MLDIILHKHFILVQLGLFSISFCLAISNKGWVTIYNNSLFYKMTITFLLLFSFIITFIEFKWWSSILYFIASFLIESTFATFIINQIIPNEYFEPTQLKLRPSSTDRFWGIVILSNYILLNILLVISFYVIFF